MAKGSEVVFYKLSGTGTIAKNIFCFTKPALIPDPHHILLHA